MSASFRVVGTTPLLQSHVFGVERRTVEHDGVTFERDIVTHPGAVAILAKIMTPRATIHVTSMELVIGKCPIRGTFGISNTVGALAGRPSSLASAAAGAAVCAAPRR